MKTAVVAIQHNEQNLKEWALWHKKLADNVFVFCDRCEAQDLNISGVVTLELKEKIPQRQFFVYNNFLEGLSLYFDYVAFIDLDEYIYLNGKTLAKFVESQPEHLSYSLNWVYFGSKLQLNHLDDKDSLLKRFQHRSKTCNKHLKPIIATKKLFMSGYKFQFGNPHCLFVQADTYRILPSYCQNGQFSNGPYMENGCPNPEDTPFIAHFYSKTKEEFEFKINRGRPDHSETSPEQYYLKRDYMWKCWEECDLNEVKDTRLCEFLYSSE